MRWCLGREHGFEGLSLKTRPIHPRLTDDRIAPEAVVTYSWVSSEPTSESGRRGAMSEMGRREPTFDAAEVPFVDQRGRLDTAFTDRSADLSAIRPDFEAGLGGAQRRSTAGRIVMLGSVVAILAGVGVLAVSVGSATFTPVKAPAESEPVDDATLALGDPQSNLVAPQSDVATTTSVVREIPLSADEEANAAAGPAAEAEIVSPPVPRPRPEIEAASLGPSFVEPPSSAAPKSASADTQQSNSAKPNQGNGGNTPAAADGGASRSPSDGSDQFIMNIEETLAKADSAPVAGSASPYGAATPPVLPPPAGVNSPGYPPSSQTPYARGPAGSTYDVLPPAPVTDNGYAIDEYPPGPMGPIPPEPVPYAYPPGTSLYDEPPTQAENEKPGIVKRTIAKTSDAVSRVFSRN
jgi:hypothetical protein